MRLSKKIFSTFLSTIMIASISAIEVAANEPKIIMTEIYENKVVLENDYRNDKEVCIIRAGYEDKRLQSMEIRSNTILKAREITEVPLSGLPSDRIFVWESLSQLKPVAYKSSKKTLLVFEIDENIAGRGLLSDNKSDYQQLERYLANIAEALAPLKEKYRVAALIYPTSHYTRGVGLDPVLEYAINVLGNYGIGTVVELISSGVGKWENETLTTMTMAPMYDIPGDGGRKGLSMDLGVLKDLKNRCGENLIGVRLHEVFGGVRRSISQPNDVKARPFDEELIKEIVHVCDEMNMELIWGDSGWLISVAKNESDSFSEYVYTNERKAYFEHSPHLETETYAESLLGNNSYFMWNNNNYNLTHNLGFLTQKVRASTGTKSKPVSNWNYFDLPFHDFPMKRFGNAKWGMSIQAWFWESVQNVLNGRSFRNNEASMPYEIMQAFVAKGLREGADVLQFEPPWYLFNMESDSWKLRNSGTSAALYEIEPDYTKRFQLDKIIETLLDYEHTPTLEEIFDIDQQSLVENDFANPPTSFKKLGLVSDTFSKAAYSYSNGFADGNLLRSYVTDNAKSAARMDVNGDGADEIAVLKGDEIFIYSSTNCLLGRIEASGAVGVTSANLIQNLVDGGDPDELLVITGADDAKSADIYEVYGFSNGMLEPQLRRLSTNEKLSMGVPDHFFWILGKRNDDIRYVNNGTRTADEIITISSSDNIDLSSDGVPFCTTADWDLDGADELLKTSDGAIKVYKNGQMIAETDFSPQNYLLSFKNTIPLNNKGINGVDMWYRGGMYNDYIVKAKMNQNFNAGNSPSAAVDGNETTYAQSLANELWDLTIDLGADETYQSMYISKGSANYASEFAVLVSSDAVSWIPILTESAGIGGSKTYDFSSATFRYAKLQVSKAAGANAHAVREIRFIKNKGR